MTTRFLFSAIIALAALLGGCAISVKPAPVTLYDLGPLPVQQTATGTLPPLAIAGIGAPAWLSGRAMTYRLRYVNEQQPRAYAESRWSMPPAELLEQRLKARIAYAGSVALNLADGAVGVPVLRIEADDFSQHFTSPTQSSGQVALRASVFRGHRLVAQKAILQQAPAPSADAAGGAKALAVAGDAALSDLLAWIATLDLR